MKSSRLLALFVGGMIGLSPGLASAALMFQDGLDGYFGTQDTELRENHPNASFGSNPSLTIDEDDASGSVDDTQALLRFNDIFAELPSGATVSKATLRLFVKSRGNSINMLQMLTGWSEASTWNDFGPNGVSHLDPEADFLRLLEGLPISGSLLSKSHVFIEIDVTADVLGWFDGDPNHGWAFTPIDDNGVDFATSEHTNASYRPKLSVRYVPEPGTLAILGLGLAGLGLSRRRRAA